MNNIGFIPVKNYIVTIEILDEKKHYDENNISILLITKHFLLLEYFSILIMKCDFYQDLQHLTCYLSITRSICFLF